MYLSPVEEYNIFLQQGTEAPLRLQFIPLRNDYLHIMCFQKQKIITSGKKRNFNNRKQWPGRLFSLNCIKKTLCSYQNFSCSEAMKKLQSQDETDLIILDIPNDTSDNYKLLQHISTSSVLSNIRTVVISNSDDPSLKHKTAELGVSLFLTKPFDPVYLSDKVRELVNVYAKTNNRKRRIPFNLNIF